MGQEEQVEVEIRFRGHGYPSLKANVFDVIFGDRYVVRDQSFGSSFAHRIRTTVGRHELRVVLRTGFGMNSPYFFFVDLPEPGCYVVKLAYHAMATRRFSDPKVARVESLDEPAAD